MKLCLLALLVLSLPLHAAPTLESVAALAQQENSLDALLDRLATYYPELRLEAVLLYDSKILQGASAEFPRAIAHTADGRFAFTFHGNPQAPGFSDLEMYE